MRLRIQAAWGPACTIQSAMFKGAMSSAGVGKLCFLKSKVTTTVYQDVLEDDLMIPSAEDLHGRREQDLAPATA